MSLSFITVSPSGKVKSVDIASTGDGATDNRTGAMCARELAQYVAATDNRPMFARVVRDMSADKSGIGMGFLFELAAMMPFSA